MQDHDDLFTKLIIRWNAMIIAELLRELEQCVSYFHDGSETITN